MHQGRENQRNLFPLAPEREGGVAARRVGRCGQVECGSASVLFEQVFVYLLLFFSGGRGLQNMKGKHKGLK